VLRVSQGLIWPKVFGKQRRLFLAAAIIGARGRVQREGEVIHLVAGEFFNLSSLLRTVGQRDLGQKPGDIFISEQRPASGIKMRARDFR
jgi:error-prone DNA polymerase